MKKDQVKRILVIDNSPFILYAFSKALRREDVAIKTVSTEEEAVVEITSHFYDLCFLDIYPPDLNGLDLLDRLKEMSPKTMVAIMTALYLDNDLEKTISQTADYFVQKPFDLYQIRTIAKSALDLGGNFYKDNQPNKGAFLKDKRQFERRPFTKPGNFYLNFIERGKSKQVHVKGEIIDISEGGIGIRTDYSLELDCLLKHRDKAGIVRWNIMVDHNTPYRVGIQYA